MRLETVAFWNLTIFIIIIIIVPSSAPRAEPTSAVACYRDCILRSGTYSCQSQHSVTSDPATDYVPHWSYAPQAYAVLTVPTVPTVASISVSRLVHIDLRRTMFATSTLAGVEGERSLDEIKMKGIITAIFKLH